MEWIGIFGVPVLTAFIGWLTNWVAVRMLFRPYGRKRFLGIRFQGVIPRRKDEIASTVAEIIERDLMNSHVITEEFRKVDLSKHMGAVVHRMVHVNLGEKLKTIPFVAGFINEDTLKTIEEMAMSSLEAESEGMMTQLGQEMEGRLDVRAMIETKIKEFDLERLEATILEAASREFRVIEWCGGVLGFIVGVIQLLVLWGVGSLCIV